MSIFVGREKELAGLRALAAEAGAQFLILYGRRRVGKTTLLLHWAQENGYPFLYWVATRFSPTLQLRSFSQAIQQVVQPTLQISTEFSFPNWEMALQQAAMLATTQRFVLILDEFPYLAEAEPGLASLVQNLWDHRFKQTQIFLVLAGSHIGMMRELMDYHAPLYGRFTGHYHLKSLPFATLSQFLPRYSISERVATYAIIGGIPAYLERFTDDVSVAENVSRRIFQPTGIFRVDPMFLLQDQVREPRNYLSVLNAIGEGWHMQGEIAKAAGLPVQNVSSYLHRLSELYWVERRAPVTLSPKRRQRTNQGRWYLLDPYLRFYFCFILPNLRTLELELYDAVWETINSQLASFIGMTVFEELCREWLLRQAQQNQLPFVPEDIGSHWSANVQIDVVASHWRKQTILLGECKWYTERIGQATIEELVTMKTPKVLASLPKQGKGWTVFHYVFSRSGFTDAAQDMAAQNGVHLVDLVMLEKVLDTTGVQSAS